MSMHFQRQIDKLKKMILSLGTLVEESVERGIRAVEARDGRLAQQVIADDSRIDAMEVDVEEECLHTLALYQPVALDLRYVVAVLKMNNDLERIGDLSVNLAEQARALVGATSLTANGLPFDLPQMVDKVRTMLKASLDALVNVDPELATTVTSLDDEVDAIHRRMYDHVVEAVQANPGVMDEVIHFLSVSRYLERIADHAVNIAEDVIYMARGQIMRHHKPLELPRSQPRV